MPVCEMHHIAVRRAAVENLPKYKHDAQASVPKTHLLALRAGIFLPAARLKAELRNYGVQERAS